MLAMKRLSMLEFPQLSYRWRFLRVRPGTAEAMLLYRSFDKRDFFACRSHSASK